MDWYVTVAEHLMIVIGVLSAFLGMVMLVVHLIERLWIGTRHIESVRPEPRGFELMPPSKLRRQRQ